MVPYAVENSPCSAWWWWKRYKVLPAGAKCAEKRYFGRAGRVLYRVGRRGRVLGEFCTGWAAGGACRESFVPVEASWHGARGRCESTVGTKGPAARAVGRMGASVSVVLGITGRCPAISHAIPREYHTGLYQFMMLCHLCFGISCEIGGGARYWGEVACWARTGKEGGGVCWQRG